MTYYEWVKYIEDLSDKEISDEVINKINTYEFDYSQNIMFRLKDHIVNVIFKKLANEKDNLYNQLDNITSSQELSLVVNKIKQTINDTYKLLNNKHFDDSLKEEVNKEMEAFIEDYYYILKEHFKGTTSNEYAIILNNLKLKEEK